MIIDPAPFKDFLRKLQATRDAVRGMEIAEVNRVADRHLARCKKNTDVGDSPYSPQLRLGWERSGAVDTGNGAQAEVYNAVNHAAFYEFGHRQTPGRVIFIEMRPGQSKYGYAAKQVKSGRHAGQWGIFLRLKKSFVKGKFVMTDSEKNAQVELDRAARKIERRIWEGFSGGRT